MNYVAKRPWLLRNIIIIFVFILISSYFASILFQNNYLGISVRKYNEDWVIKEIQSEGSGRESGVATGDHILKIDDVPVANNRIVNKWLIVEQAEKIHLLRNNVAKEVVFLKSRVSLKRFLFFFIISMISLCLLLYFYQRQAVNQKSKDYYFFVLLIIFGMLAVVPSSIGNNLGRFLVVVVVSFFPVLLFNFFNTKEWNKWLRNLISFFIKGLALVNLFLVIASLFITLPYLLTKYLTTGIFWLFGGTLICFFLEELTRHFFSSKKNEISRVNAALISLLSVAPLFLFYILPTKWLVPFPYVVIFMILPSFGIFHLLILSRYLRHTKKVLNVWLYLVLSILLSGTIFLFSLLSQHIFIGVLMIYLFLLIYAFMPLVEEAFLVLKRNKEHSDSLALFNAVEDERENMSVFIHDTVIQEVIYTIRELRDSDSEISKEKMLLELEDVVFSLRELCSDIYPLMIQEKGLKDAILSVTNQIEQKYPVEIQTQFAPIMPFSAKINNFILRSTTELITNSIIHGKASDITLLITMNNNKFHLTVIDNGAYVKKNRDTQQHFGLDVIKEKLTLIGGELLIEVDDKTTVTIVIPYSNEEGEPQ